MPTFTALYREIFKPLCGTAAGCHGDGVANLNMSSQAAAYASLVNTPIQPEQRCGQAAMRMLMPTADNAGARGAGAGGVASADMSGGNGGTGAAGAAGAAGSMQGGAASKIPALRVTPGDAANSLLALKIEIHPPCGQQMPPGGSLADDSRAAIRRWIDLGALDN